MDFCPLSFFFEVYSCCLLCLETTQLCFVRKYIFLLLFLFLDPLAHPTNIRTLCILKYEKETRLPKIAFFIEHFLHCCLGRQI